MKRAPWSTLEILSVVEIDGNNPREMGRYVDDPGRAHEHARNIGGLVLARAYVVLGDYRPDAHPTEQPPGFRPSGAVAPEPEPEPEPETCDADEPDGLALNCDLPKGHDGPHEAPWRWGQ